MSFKAKRLPSFHIWLTDSLNYQIDRGFLLSYWRHPLKRLSAGLAVLAMIVLCFTPGVSKWFLDDSNHPDPFDFGRRH